MTTMTTTTTNEPIRLEVSEGLGKDAKIDRDARMIRGFQVMRKGTAKGHGFEIDDKTLDQLIEAGQRLPNGARGHFGHEQFLGPDSLATYMGRVRNFRRDDDVVRADFQFAVAANEMPGAVNGAQAIMDLAEEDPQAFGASVVVRARVVDDEDDDNTRRLRIASLRGVDWVGEPAATTGVFSAAGGANHVSLLQQILDNMKRLMGRSDKPENDDGTFGGNPEQEEISMSNKTIDLSAVNLDQLRQQRPDLVAAVREEVKTEVRNERTQEVREDLREEVQAEEWQKLKANIATVKDMGEPGQFYRCLAMLEEGLEQKDLERRLKEIRDQQHKDELDTKRQATANTIVSQSGDQQISDLDARVQTKLAEMKKYAEKPDEVDEVDAFAKLCAEDSELDQQLNAPRRE